MENIILDLLHKHSEQLTNIENLLGQRKTVLNLSDVCNLTGLSKSHIYKLTCLGKMPFYKQSKHLFFDRLEVENWLKTNRCAPKEEIERQAANFVILNPKMLKK